MFDRLDYIILDKAPAKRANIIGQTFEIKHTLEIASNLNLTWN